MDLEIMELKRRLSLMQRHLKLQSKMQLLLYKQIQLQMEIREKDSQQEIAELKRMLTKQMEQRSAVKKYPLPINLSLSSDTSDLFDDLSDSFENTSEEEI